MEQSPCVKICTLNNDNICIGCGRNAYELQNWATFSDDIKRDIKAQLKDRLAEVLQKMRAKRTQN